MEIRLRSILIMLCIAVVVIAVGLTGGLRLPVGRRAPATSTVAASQPTVALTPTGPRVTFADESVVWDWQVSCGDALWAWLQQYPHAVRTIRVTLTDAQDFGSATVGVGYPASPTPIALAYATCAGTPDLACQVAIKQGAPGADLNVAVTAAIPHAIRNAWLIRAPSGAEHIDAIRVQWSWAQFQPLLQGAGSTWRSSCLNVAKP